MFQDGNELRVEDIKLCRPNQVSHIQQVNPLLHPLRIAERVQLHRDEMQRAGNGQSDVLADFTPPTFRPDFSDRR